MGYNSKAVITSDTLFITPGRRASTCSQYGTCLQDIMYRSRLFWNSHTSCVIPCTVQFESRDHKRHTFHCPASSRIHVFTLLHVPSGYHVQVTTFPELAYIMCNSMYSTIRKP